MYKRQEFKDYAGPPKDFNHGVIYFIQKFKECLISDEQEFKDSFIHVTCATDTNNSEYFQICFLNYQDFLHKFL